MKDFERVADKSEQDAKKMLEGNFSFEDFEANQNDSEMFLKIFCKNSWYGKSMEMIPKRLWMTEN